MANPKVTVDVLLSTNTALKGLAALGGAFAAVFAGRKILQGINAITDAASIQEDAINNLNTALARSGEFTEAASREIQAFASSIQASTKFGDEAILQQFALAKAFGASKDQAKLITQAAVELAAATGKSLDEATRQVSKTLGGFAGELGEVNPQIKALTKEQLQAGEAAKILLQQFGGTAAAQLNTFSGATTAASNSFGDLLEELGFIITKNPAVIKAINFIQVSLIKLATVVADNRGSIIAFINQGLKKLINPLRAVLPVIDFIIDTFTVLKKTVVGVFSFIGSTRVFKDLTEDLVNLFNTVKNFATAIGSKVFSAFEGGALKLAVKLESGESKDAGKAIRDVFESSSTSFSEGASKALDDIEKALSIDPDSSRGLAGQGAPGGGAAAPAVAGAKSPFTTGNIGAALGTFTQGAQGAGALFSQAATIFAETVIPGLGAFAGQLITFLAQGPEAVQAQIQAFVEAVPQIVTAIVDSLPVIVPALLQSFAENLPEFFAAAARVYATTFLPIIQIEIIKNIPTIAQEFVKGLIQGIPLFIKTLADAIGDLFKGLLGGGSSGIPIVGGIADTIGGLFGFQEGGAVPDISRFRNDGALARVSAGEEVLTRDLSNRLSDFISRGGNAGAITVNLQVGEENLARVLFNLNERGFRTA